MFNKNRIGSLIVIALLAFPYEVFALIFVVPEYLQGNAAIKTPYQKVIDVFAMRKKYDLTVLHASIKRVHSMVEQQEADLAFLETTTGEGYYLSSVGYSLNAIAVLLDQKKANKIKNPLDLLCCSVVAFQNSDLYLGQKYAEMVKLHPNFRATHNQLAQVKQLYTGRTEAIVIADSIFEYYKPFLSDDLQKIPVAYAYFLPKQVDNIKLIFKDKSVRDWFEQNF